MTRRLTHFRTIGVTFCLVVISVNAQAKVKGNTPTTSASHVSAEMTKGILNPSETRPGDEIALRLKDDVKANGDVVLRAGTTITGVVRNVKTVAASGRVQSVAEIEWIVPPVQGKVPRQISIALQSVTRTNRAAAPPQSGTTESSPAGSGTIQSFTPIRRTATSNAALLNMPSVIAVDTRTASSLESSFGPSSGQLFKVGRSEWISASGARQSMEFFSHLSNDTMITSPGRDFEITIGAQMQLLVGVSKP